MALVKLLAVALVALLFQWWWYADERENNRHINPSIFEAFRGIEDRCAAEQFPNQTVRCQEAIELIRSCSALELGCSANEYYDSLLRLGFHLPPFYEQGYRPK